MYPESKAVTVRGGPGRGHKTNEIISFVSFSEDTATKTGFSSRIIQQEAQLRPCIQKQKPEASILRNISGEKRCGLNYFRRQTLIYHR